MHKANYPTEDIFYCYVLTKLTNFAAVHCYYKLQQVGTFDILAVWICNYARARDDPSLIVETCYSWLSVYANYAF